MHERTCRWEDVQKGSSIHSGLVLRDAQTNAVANIECEVTQAVFFDDVPAVVKDGVDE